MVGPTSHPPKHLLLFLFFLFFLSSLLYLLSCLSWLSTTLPLLVRPPARSFASSPSSFEPLPPHPMLSSSRFPLARPSGSSTAWSRQTLVVRCRKRGAQGICADMCGGALRVAGGHRRWVVARIKRWRRRAGVPRWHKGAHWVRPVMWGRRRRKLTGSGEFKRKKVGDRS